MNENKAIEELKYDCEQLGKGIPCDTGCGVMMNEAYRIAIEALQEIQQYRSIGTPDECRAAVEKQRAKKPSDISEEYSFFDCHACGKTIYASGECLEHNYCLNCGQAIDWSDND